MRISKNTAVPSADDPTVAEIESTTEYTVEGTTILAEKRILDSVETLISYHYGSDGIFGFTYNGTEYYYGKNLFGDITDIYDASGVKVAHYAYDAWGNHTVYNGSGMPMYSLDFIGVINPFRYRGYYYDIESGYYYLQSRYYDPTKGRFLNADTLPYLGADGELRGYNLYAYCGNNPVMYTDPNGHIAFFVVTAIIGTVVGFGLAAYNDYKEDGVWFNSSIESYIKYMLSCATIGALTGLVASSLLVGNFLASCSQVYLGLQGLAWAYTMGGTGAAGLYIANNFLNSIHVNSSWLGYWPSNNGFSGSTQSLTLQQGTVVQRFGGTSGTFVSPYFTDPMSLSLPYHQLPNMNNPNLYIVNYPIIVTAGQAAPWFGQYGGGTQYLLPQTIQELINSGILSKF